MDDSWLEELFIEHGEVVDARVVYERRGGTWRLQGFGFVTMATEEETCDAVYAFNKQVSVQLVVSSINCPFESPLRNLVLTSNFCRF